MSGWTPSPRILRQELEPEEIELRRRVDCANYDACGEEMIDEAGWYCPSPAFCFQPGDQHARDLVFALRRRGD